MVSKRERERETIENISMIIISNQRDGDDVVVSSKPKKKREKKSIACRPFVMALTQLVIKDTKGVGLLDRHERERRKKREAAM